jgi:hypothetical protein
LFWILYWICSNSYEDLNVVNQQPMLTLSSCWLMMSMWGEKFAQELNARINFWCPSWMCSINMMWEGNVTDLNLDIKLMNFTLVLIVSMQKMRGYMSLHGMILILTKWFCYCPNVKYKEGLQEECFWLLCFIYWERVSQWWTMSA